MPVLIPDVEAVKEYVRKNATPEWQIDIEYSLNDIVFREGSIYKSLINNNEDNDPDLDELEQYWTIAAGAGGGVSNTEYLIHPDYNDSDFVIGTPIANLGGFAAPASKDDPARVNVVGLCSNVNALINNVTAQKIALLEDIDPNIIGPTVGALEFPSGSMIDGVQVEGLDSLGISAFSVFAWVYLKTGSLSKLIFGNQEQFAFYVGGFSLFFTFKSSGSNVGMVSAPDIFVSNMEKWVHVGFTWNGSNQTMYFNGEPVATGTFVGAVDLGTTSLRIGGGAFVDSLGGLLSEPFVYSKALTLEESKSLYQGKIITSDLELYLELNEGSGSILRDSSSNDRQVEIFGSNTTWGEYLEILRAGRMVFVGDNGFLIQYTKIIEKEEYRLPIGYVYDTDAIDIQLSEPLLISDSPQFWDGIPLGGLIFRSATQVQDGYVVADGRELSREFYSELNTLYAGDNYPHGNGDGSTTFNIPDYADPAIIIKVRYTDAYTQTEYISVDERLSALEDSLTAYPVDSQYIQVASVNSNTESVAFPVDERPATIYGGTWTQLWDSEGVFFRTEGTGATADNAGRVNGQQPDQMQRLEGTGFRYGGGGTSTSMTFTGVFSRGGASGGSIRYDTSGNTGVLVNFDSANSPNARASATTAGETRSVNRLIKIWIREV